MNIRNLLPTQYQTIQQGSYYAGVCHVNTRGLHTCAPKTIQSQKQYLKICLAAGMTVNFGTKLQWLPRGMWHTRSSVQYRAAVTQTCYARVVQNVGIYTSDLRRAVSAQAHGASRELIHQLESLQIKRFSSARQQ